jgi:hypothetical protein
MIDCGRSGLVSAAHSAADIAASAAALDSALDRLAADAMNDR